MRVRKTIRSVRLAAASIFLLVGMMPSDAGAFTKSSCTGCGCKYERECENGPQGAWCMSTCLCPAGTPAGCMDTKISAVHGVKISKSPTQTIYRLRVAPEKVPEKK
jgi:hypothetical protein